MPFEPGADRRANDQGAVIAVLGPTNTGKTHYAIERMLGHRSGVIGFPLRLLAREVYDRVVAMRGPQDVALITGEEKIFPRDARFVLCTVESMPVDWGADFLAVDEIQLCADPERGHVFTNRLLSARGRVETLFLGSQSMRERIASLAPGVRFVSRERLSTLSYAGAKKISRLPPRSAIVAFSVDNVYAIAELIRRHKGGAAVVMGALSPRTRNAQVALYQEGDVEYLVATDAIGMGLNMDVRHVAFAGLSKFDGRKVRRLFPHELGQIAGRAGRHLNDGTFGVTGEAAALDPDAVAAIESHRYAPVTRLQWRNADLDFASAASLIRSLEREPRSEDLARTRENDDLATLRSLADDPIVAAKASGRSAVRRLWDACQVPDFRKTGGADHSALVGQLFGFLTSEAGVVPEDWMAKAVARVDRTDGDIDALSKRLAFVRTWTYVANRADWLRDPAHWRGVTREIEDRLSDALHARLTQRFVDRRTSVLARRLKQKERLVATIEADGAVTVEGEFVGRLEGFRFQPDPEAAGAEVKTLQAAGAQALAAELARRVESFYNAPDGEIDVTEQGGLMWGAAAVGRLEPKSGGEGDDPLATRAIAFADDMLEQPLREKIERRLQFWIDRKIEAAFEPLLAMRKDEALTGLARGVAYQLIERLGVIPRQEIAADIRALEQADRGLLRKHGVRFGQHTIFLPSLLKPAPTRFRILLWGLRSEMDEIPSPPPPGLVTIPTAEGVELRYYAMAGYRPCGARALRLDMLERLADLIRPLDARDGFEATAEMLSITGTTLEQFAEMMEGLGYRGERGERPKKERPASPAEGEAAPDAAAEDPSPGPETASGALDVPAEALEASEAATAEETSAGTTSADLTSAGLETDEPIAAADASETTAPEPAASEPAASEAVAEAPAIAETVETPPVEQDSAAETAPTDETPPEENPTDETPADLAPTDDGPTEDAAPEPADAEPARAEAIGDADEIVVAPLAADDQASTAAEAASQTEQDAPRSESADATAAEPPLADTETTGPASQTDDDDKPAELEIFYVFRLAPKARRPRGDRPARGRRQGAGPADAAGSRPPRADGGRDGARDGPREGRSEGRSDGRSDSRRDNRAAEGGGRGKPRRPDREGGQQGGKQGGRNAAEGGGKPRRYEAAASGGDERKRGDRSAAERKGGDRGQRQEGGGGRHKREQRVDPDSPFAILAKLKEKS